MDDAIKQRWRQFIYSSDSGARYLSSIGSAVMWSEQLAVDDLDIAEFLRRLRGGINDVRLLANAIDLLRCDYLEYLVRDGSRLLDHLSNEIVRMDEIVGPALRGNPRWDRTVLGRMSGQLGAGRYYSRTSHRSFERPENLLLKWLLDNLLKSIHFLGKKIGAERLHPALRSLFSKCEEIARHHWLSAVPTPTRLDFEMVTAGRRHRRPEYRKAAELAFRRSELEAEVSHGRWKSILSLMTAGWLEPIESDDLFELYALALCLDVLNVDLGYGAPVEYSLVARDRAHVASFEKNGARIRVYFDQAPKISLGAEGRFPAIVRAHRGITGSAHRPDITIVKHSPTGGQSVMFLEVKNSRSNVYLAESIYKAFAYLYDFQELWHPTQPNPRVVLFVPDHTGYLQHPTPPEVAFVSGEDRSMLSAFLRSALSETSTPTEQMCQCSVQ